MELNYQLQLDINNESSIKSLQKEFSKYYPFLKIEFFNNYFEDRQLLKALAPTSFEVNKKFGASKNKTAININKEKKVSELENDLENLTGLSVLVFRKSGNVWVETSLTDDWTLGQQNIEGEQISIHFP